MNRPTSSGRRARILWGLVAALVLLAGALAIRVTTLRMQLRELEWTLGARPANGDVPEEVFQDLAQAGLKSLADLKDEPLSCRAARQGDLHETPDEVCRAWVELHWPAAAIVLSATNARLARWDVRDLASQSDVIEGLAAAGRVATLHLMLNQSMGLHASAVHTCLEVLGLGRDAATTGTLLGVTVGNAIVRGVFNACTWALEDASVEAKQASAEAIQRISEGLTPASRRYHSEPLAQVATLMKEPTGWGLDQILDEDAFVASVRAYEAISRMAHAGDLQPPQVFSWSEWFRELSLDPRAQSPTSPSASLAPYQALQARLRLLQQAAAP